MQESIRKSNILIEALPYIQAFHGKVIVAKYGGSAIDNPTAIRGILQDLIFLSAVGIRSVLVHGGGPLITRKLSAAGKNSRFIEGMRVTDAETIRIVNRELGAVNRRLVAQIRSLGGQAEGVVPRQRVVVAEPHARADELGLRAFMIHSRDQGKGYATAAVLALKPYLAARYPKRSAVLLTVNMQNPGAIRCYLKGGFADTGGIYPHGLAGPQHILRMGLAAEG